MVSAGERGGGERARGGERGHGVDQRRVRRHHVLRGPPPSPACLFFSYFLLSSLELRVG